MSGIPERVIRDLITEEAGARNRTVEEVEEQQAEEERNARHLFADFTELTRPYLLKIQKDDETTPPADLSKEQLVQCRFTEAGKLRREIEESDHFLDADVFENGQIVRVQIQLHPLHGNSLEAASRFTISLPGSKTIKDTFELREKAAGVKPAGRAVDVADYGTLMRLHGRLSNTELVYRRQAKIAA